MSNAINAFQRCYCNVTDVPVNDLMFYKIFSHTKPSTAKFQKLL